MPLSRREFLRLAGMVALGTASAACAPVYRRLAHDPQAGGPWPAGDERAFRALSRMTFGPRPGERRLVEQMGLAGWIEAQLAPEAINDDAAEWRTRGLQTLSMSAAELVDWHDQLFDAQDRASVIGELRQATLLRQVYSRRQLYEVMVEFWSDHFNISTAKGDCWFLKTVDDRAVTRRYALGGFRDLLWASAHSPAMLVYLDNQANRRGSPNENYARELMELHTLGVDSGYSQQDVQELARCLTGWTVKEHFWRGQFTFDAQLHDTGTKRVLGMTIEPEGQREAERVLDHLASQPATARLIATKLTHRFLGHADPGLVERTARAYRQTGGDIRAMLRVVLLDGLATGGAALAPRIKRPVDFVASCLRLLDVDTDGGNGIQGFLERMGQPYFAWPAPDGYPDHAEAWQGNLLPRWQFALDLARGSVPGTTVRWSDIALDVGGREPASLLAHLGSLLLGAPLATEVADRLLASLRAAGQSAEEEWPAVLTAGLLASPAFQWR